MYICQFSILKEPCVLPNVNMQAGAVDWHEWDVWVLFLCCFSPFIFKMFLSWFIELCNLTNTPLALQEGIYCTDPWATPNYQKQLCELKVYLLFYKSNFSSCGFKLVWSEKCINRLLKGTFVQKYRKIDFFSLTCKFYTWQILLRCLTFLIAYNFFLPK